MEKLSCVIVDDDLVSAHLTEALVKRTPFLHLQALYTDPQAALQYLRQQKTELIFLDMEMPGMTGLQLLEQLVDIPAVIVISAKREYAFDAFFWNVADYLVKPLTDYERFLKAASKVREIVTHNRSLTQNSALFIKVDAALHNINLSDILFIEAFGDYIKVHLADRVLTTLATMKLMEVRLSPDFIRIHRSFLVNLRKISSIEPAHVFIATKPLPIGESYKEALMNRISLL